MANSTATTVNLSDLSETDRKIVEEYFPLVMELFLVAPESSTCDNFKVEIISFLEMYKSVFGEKDGTWKISTAEAIDENLLKFRSPYRKLFQQNAYLCLSKFPQAPKFRPGETTNDAFTKQIFSEHNWMCRLNTNKREVFFKSLQNRAIADFEENLRNLIADIEVIYDEDKFRKNFNEIREVTVKKFKSQIPHDEGILSISLFECKLNKEITSTQLSEDSKARFLEATENAAKKASNILKRCLEQCSNRSDNFSDDVDVICNINGIPELYKTRLQEKVTKCIQEVFKEIEVQSIANEKNQENLLTIISGQRNASISKTLEIAPKSKELPQRTILRTLPPAPGRDNTADSQVDEKVPLKTEKQPSIPDTPSTILDVATGSNDGNKPHNLFQFSAGTSFAQPKSKFSGFFTRPVDLGSKSKLPPAKAMERSNFAMKFSERTAESFNPSFGSQIRSTLASGFTFKPPGELKFSSNFKFDLIPSVTQEPSNTIEPLVTAMNKVAVGKPKNGIQHTKQATIFAFPLPKAPVFQFKKDLPPLCIHLQDSQIEIGMMINGKLKKIKDKFGNTLIPAVVAYSKHGKFLWGSQVDTRDMFQLLKHVWWLLKPGQDSKLFTDEIIFWGKSFKVSIEFLLAFVLRKLKLFVETEMKGTCKNALIIVPLHFTSVQRLQIKHSAEIAGFSENHLIEESIAICHAYRVKNNYDGFFMVLCKSFNTISAYCINCDGILFNSYQHCVSYFSCSLHCYDESNIQADTIELKCRQACIEATKQYKNKLCSEFKGSVCITSKSNFKWVSILEKVGREFGNGEVKTFNDAISGAALLQNDLSKYKLFFKVFFFDVVVESEKTGKLETVFDKTSDRTPWFKHILIDGSHASVYQIDSDKKRTLVASINVEHVAYDEVVEFKLQISYEGVISISLPSKRSTLSKVIRRVYLSNKEVNFSTCNLSESDVQHYTARLPFV